MIIVPRVSDSNRRHTEFKTEAYAYFANLQPMIGPSSSGSGSCGCQSHALGIRHWSSYTILGCTYRLRVEMDIPPSLEIHLVECQLGC